MKLLTSTTIFSCVVLCALAQAIPDKSPTLPTPAPITPTTSTTPTPSTTSKPTPKPTTPEPTTPKPTEPPTTKPTTPEPTKPTTPQPTTPKPTEPPTPKPTSPPTPTPTPTPSTPAPTPSTTAAPKAYDWEVVGADDVVCILAKMNININLKYKSDPHKDIHMEVPKNATSTGTCGDVNQTLTLSWGTTDNSNLTMTFHMDNKTKDYYVSSFVANVFDNKASSNLSLDHLFMYQTKNSSSYSCSYSSPVELKNDNATLQVTLTEIRLEAFRNSNTTTFSNAISCPPDSPDLVPIVVGIALTLLIIVVLVTYLIGRRRNLGYTSM